MGPALLPAFLAIVEIVGLLGVALYLFKASSGDPTFWEREIRKFEKEDRRRPPPQGAIVFAGSSSIHFWDTLQADMAPLPVLNRGFGGSQIHQVTYFADRIVFPYQPKAIVFYAGENDIAGVFFSRKKTAAEVRDAYQHFCDEIHARLPEASIYFVSIKPPQARRQFWPVMQGANQLVREYCAADQRRHYIDIVPAVLDGAGRTRRDIFKWDGIHLNAKGYAVWTSVIKPMLLEAYLNSPL